MKKKHNQEPIAETKPLKLDAEKEQAQSQVQASTARNIFVFGRLENEIALPTIKKLLRFNERDPKKPINMYINSAGGNGYNADGIIAVMHSIEAPVNTICLGHALSGACEILASGTGERSAYEFSTLMFHQTLWEAEGDITNLEIQASQGRRFREAQIELLHRCSGQDKARIAKDIERDHYLSTKEALEYGLIDKILPHGGHAHGAGQKTLSKKALTKKPATKKTPK
ncbi:MAG: ATP-dependent Clp protease proteolytic subunit [Candidatus Melainabacteria bacterium]|nr:ATP-dependent Clp protease proteolytic subunit [Candidatus Melainabacteria bacterium]